MTDLHQLVEHQHQATVLFTESGRVLPARFEVADRTTVTLLLYQSPLTPPTAGHICCVQVVMGDATQIFLARVLVVVRDEDGLFLTLQQPSEIARMEARRAFRVPLTDRELPVELVGPRGRGAAWVRDLSRLGVGLQLASVGDAPEVGDFVRVRVSRPDGLLVIPGEVVRQDADVVGIAFTADAPAGLGPWVVEAESRWLQRQRAPVTPR